MIMRSMSPIAASRWTTRLLTLCLAGVAAASAVAWALCVQGLQTTAVVPAVAMVPAGAVDSALVARALGAANPAAAQDAPAPVLASSRFVLMGVVASGKQGAALIAVDGAPAKPYAVGSKVGSDFVLLSVQPRKAVLAGTASDGTRSGGELTLSMPPVGDKKAP